MLVTSGHPGRGRSALTNAVRMAPCLWETEGEKERKGTSDTGHRAAHTARLAGPARAEPPRRQGSAWGPRGPLHPGEGASHPGRRPRAGASPRTPGGNGLSARQPGGTNQNPPRSARSSRAALPARRPEAEVVRTEAGRADKEGVPPGCPQGCGGAPPYTGNCGSLNPQPWLEPLPQAPSHSHAQ